MWCINVQDFVFIQSIYMNKQLEELFNVYWVQQHVRKLSKAYYSLWINLRVYIYIYIYRLWEIGIYYRLKNPSSVFSRTGYLVTYARWPKSWLLNIQIEISLLSTKSEDIILSHSMWVTMHMMILLEEVKTVSPIKVDLPKI